MALKTGLDLFFLVRTEKGGNLAAVKKKKSLVTGAFLS